MTLLVITYSSNHSNIIVVIIIMAAVMQITKRKARTEEEIIWGGRYSKQTTLYKWEVIHQSKKAINSEKANYPSPEKPKK